MQVGGVPAAEDCMRNWWVLRDADLDFSSAADASIYRYLRDQWYAAQDHPPPLELVKEYFEKSDDIDASDRVEELKRAHHYIRTNYQAICRSEREAQERKQFSLLLREAGHILEHGMNLERPVDGKKIARGMQDAKDHLLQRLGRIGQSKDDLSAADALTAYVSMHSAPRIRTGVPAIDNSFEGGLPARRLVVLGGAPGAGKTSFAVFLAHALMMAGHPCAFLAADEAAEGIVGRVCKLEGLTVPTAPPALEGVLRLIPEPRREELAASARVANLPYFINEGATIEQMVDRLLRFAEVRKMDRAPVLVVDSIQVVRASGSGAAPDPRQRVDAVIRALKQAVSRGVLVIATSELNRGSYKSKKADEQVADIAATKESSAIEYGAQTLLIFRTTADEDVVSVNTPKNRGGRKPSFRLRLDRERMTYAQIEDEAPAQAGVTEDGELLAQVLLASPPVTSVHQIRAACRAHQGEPKLTNSERIDAAKAYLEMHGRLIKKNGVYAVVKPPKVQDMLA